LERCLAGDNPTLWSTSCFGEERGAKLWLNGPTFSALGSVVERASLADFAGLRINDRDLVARVVNEQLLTGRMRLT
jgi:hypothetical protein